jgi:uncharacterized beta-barrel protein YwiB (DUF1934 family)
MKKERLISIRGMQDYEGTDNDSIELVTKGTLSRAGNGWVLSYEESELTGLEGTTTTIQVEGERVSLQRTGAVCSQMVFEEKRKHLSLYETPYGAMEVSVSAQSVRHNISEAGGEIEVTYRIELDHTMAGENTFRITARPQN